MSDTPSPVDFLRRAFPGIHLDEAEEINTSGVICQYPADTVLCHEGTIESTFYIILSGEVKVVKRTEEGGERQLNILGKGAFFGEMALIHNAPRVASVITTAPSRVIEIQKEDFRQLLEHSNTVSLIMIREVSRRLRENDLLAIEDLRLKATEMAEAFQQLAEQDLARRSYLDKAALTLRSPLITATGLLQEMGNAPQDNHSVDLTGTTAKTLREIIAAANTILFIQNQEMVLPEFSAIDLHALVSLVVEENRPQAEYRRVRVQVQAAAMLPAVQGDPYALRQAISALVNNAIKFSFPGGDVLITFQPGKTNIMVRIADEGIGIEPAALERIFERYYHIDQVGDEVNNGAGLGLSLAQAILDKHGGQIEVATRLGLGSTFSIRLPLRHSSTSKSSD